MVKHQAPGTRPAPLATSDGKADHADLDTLFSALAHPIRRAIIERLAAGDTTVSELAEPHDVSAPAISKHLRVLEDAGLLEQTAEGRVRRCSLDARPLGDAFGWLTRYRVFWENKLDALAEYLEGDDDAGRSDDHEPNAVRDEDARDAPPDADTPHNER